MRLSGADDWPNTKELLPGSAAEQTYMWAAAQVAARPEFQGKRIVTILCAVWVNVHLSTPLFGDLGT